MTEIMGPLPPTATYFVDHVAGEIRAFGLYSLDQAAYAERPGMERVEVSAETYGAVRSGPESHYCDDGLVVAREASPVTLSAVSFDADGVDELLISGVPEGARIRISGAVAAPWTVVTTGSVTLTSTELGRVVVEIRSPPPYANWMGVVDAV